MVASQSSLSKTDSASRWLLGSTISAAELAALVLLGCSSGGAPPPERQEPPPPEAPAPGVLRLPFLVEDYFVPSGCFGDGDCQGGVLGWESGSCPEAGASVQGRCRAFVYSPLAQDAPGYRGFLGLIFQRAAGGPSAIGRVPPLPIQGGAQRVVFWAKVEPAEVVVGFRAGGANNWEGETDESLPYKDDFGISRDVTLTAQYQQIELDLRGVQYESVVSPFGWAIEARGRTAPIRLSVADVRWE